MEKIIKAIKIGGEVNTFIDDMLNPILEGIELLEEFSKLIDEYFHEHPDVKTDDVYLAFKISTPSFSLTADQGKTSCPIISPLKDLVIKKQILNLS